MVEVAQDQSFPTVQQISFFLPNKVGSLQRVVDTLDQAGVKLCALSILDAHDHAVVRTIVDKPGKAVQVLGSSGRAICVSSLVAIAVPANDPDVVSRLLSTLLRAELNVHYSYALVVQHEGSPILAVRTENLDTAAQTLRRAGFTLIDQRDLERIFDGS